MQTFFKKIIFSFVMFLCFYFCQCRRSLNKVCSCFLFHVGSAGVCLHFPGRKMTQKCPSSNIIFCAYLVHGSGQARGKENEYVFACMGNASWCNKKPSFPCNMTNGCQGRKVSLCEKCRCVSVENMRVLQSFTAGVWRENRQDTQIGI